MTARWSIGLFFALVAIPFVAVWTMTQGPKAMDRLFPVYEVVKVGDIEQTSMGLTIKNVSLHKRYDCAPQGVFYASFQYDDVTSKSEILIPVERGADGKPFVAKYTAPAGSNFTIDEMRLVASGDLIARSSAFRFMITCHRPFIGETHAYTNPVRVGAR